MITAEIARKNLPFDIESEIVKVNANIQSASKDGKRMITYRGRIADENHSNTPPAYVKEFEKSFADRGFKIEYKVEYRSMGADLWFEISW